MVTKVLRKVECSTISEMSSAKEGEVSLRPLRESAQESCAKVLNKPIDVNFAHDRIIYST